MRDEMQVKWNDSAGRIRCGGVCGATGVSELGRSSDIELG